MSSWVYRQDREAGYYDYSLAVEVLQFFIDYIGPYPYRKLANVQSKTRYGGMVLEDGSLTYGPPIATGVSTTPSCQVKLPHRRKIRFSFRSESVRITASVNRCQPIRLWDPAWPCSTAG